MPRTSWTAKKSNKIVVREADTTRLLMNRILKFQATFFGHGHVMRREKLVTTGMIEGKRSMGRQHEKMLDGLTKWLKVGRVTKALKAFKDRDVWKIMTTYAEEHGT